MIYKIAEVCRRQDSVILKEYEALLNEQGNLEESARVREAGIEGNKYLAIARLQIVRNELSQEQDRQIAEYKRQEEQRKRELGLIK